MPQPTTPTATEACSDTMASRRSAKRRNRTLGAILILVAGFPSIAAANRAESVRFATYNVQFIPSIAQTTTTTRRAAHVAKRILAADYDFIALNEVFDEDTRETLVRDLAAAYPHRVEKLASASLEDSGLMLFSRFPFIDLADPRFRVCEPFLPGSSNCRPRFPDPFSCQGTDCPRVAYLEYEACDEGGVPPFELDDCDADKGIAFVRLQNPRTGHIYNVGFTHTQASYQFPADEEDGEDEEEHQATRRTQIQTAIDVVTTSAGQAVGEEVLLIGDLNIDGNLNNLVPPYDVYAGEWVEAFGDSIMSNTGTDGYVLQRGFIDAWAADVATVASGIEDPAFTNLFVYGPRVERITADGGRLDYVVRRQDNPLCIQRMTLAHELRWSDDDPVVEAGMGLAGREQLSDHIGISVDINVATPGCNVGDAHPLSMVPGEAIETAGEIVHPGGMQWYRLPPGDSTYSIRVDGADFRTFSADDLSVPVPQFKGRTAVLGGGIGDTYRSPDFVQVFRADREATGPFTLHVLRHECASPEQPCALAPARRRVESVDDGGETWSVLVPETVPPGTSRTEQHVTYLVRSDGPSAAALLELVVLGPDAATVLTTGVLEPDPDDAGTLRLTAELADTGGSTRFVVVRPRAPLAEPISFSIEWRTDMTILHGSTWGSRRPMLLYCYEESDGFLGGVRDTILLKQTVIDGRTRQIGKKLGDFDAASHRPLEHYILKPPGPPIDRLAFFESAVVKFQEEDDLSANERITIGIPALDPSDPGSPRKQARRDNDGDGLYGFFYSVAHGFDEREPAGLAPDVDADGLSDAAEVLHGTDPNDADSDDDGLFDGDEIALHATGPLDPDSDDDGLRDGREVDAPFTDPLDPDTDDDGLLDGPELFLLTNPRDADTDDDGLTDGTEVDVTRSDPLDADTDDDSLVDGSDNCPLDSNVIQADLDGDGFGDVCDETDAILDLRRARVRRDTRRTRPNGDIVVTGHIVLASPADHFDARDGLLVRIRDGAGLDETFTWSSGECRHLGSGRINCRTADGDFRQLSEPLSAQEGRIRFRLRFNARAIAGPFVPGLDVRMVHSPAIERHGIDRVGGASSCRITANGMQCRQGG